MTEGMPARRSEINKHYRMKTLAENPFGSTLPTLEKRSPTTRQTLCSLLDSGHFLDRAARGLDSISIPDEIDLVTLQRLRDRVDEIARLMSEAIESLKLVGVDKNDAFIEIDDQLIGLQEVSRRIRKARLELAEVYRAIEQGTRSPVTGPPAVVVVAAVGDVVVAVFVVVGKIFAVGAVVGAALWTISEIAEEVAENLTNLFNQSDDDKARERVSAATPEEIQRISDNELVSMIDAMLDGPTGDDDERAILKILEALDCAARIRIADRVGVGELLDNIDGSEWDRLVNLLADCGIIGIGDLDDDGSRYFVNTHSCAQLGQLSMSSLRQLVLNMFSGSCGDEDEDAILKLLRCQSKERLHQLVGMPGTDVGRFDYNFDGDQWDHLESFFAANGITLD